MTDAARRYWPALIIAIPLLIVLPLAVIGVAQTPPPLRPACGDEIMQEQTREAMRAGIDRAMRDQIARLYFSWMQDDTAQPRRASQGTTHAIDRHVHGRRAIDNWSLKPC